MQFKIALKFMRGLDLGQVKLVNCNQFLGKIAYQNCRVKFHMKMKNRQQIEEMMGKDRIK